MLNKQYLNKQILQQHKWVLFNLLLILVLDLQATKLLVLILDLLQVNMVPEHSPQHHCHMLAKHLFRMLQVLGKQIQCLKTNLLLSLKVIQFHSSSKVDLIIKYNNKLLQFSKDLVIIPNPNKI